MRIYFSFLLKAIEVEAEVRIGSCAIDFERNLGAGSVLLKDPVEWHQQHASPTSDHSGHSGLHIGRSGEVEFSTIEAICAGKLDGRAGNVVAERLCSRRARKIGAARKSKISNVAAATIAIARGLIPTQNHALCF
jgi:hypothetical protein